MNMTADKRSTAYVRRLRVGDKFNDEATTWVVTREPEVVDGKGVIVYIRPLPDGERSRAYMFDLNQRIRVIH